MLSRRGQVRGAASTRSATARSCGHKFFLTPTRARAPRVLETRRDTGGLLTRGGATSPPDEGEAPYFVCPWLLESWKAATSYWLTALGFLLCSIPAA